MNTDEHLGSVKGWKIFNHWDSEELCSVSSTSMKSCSRCSRTQPAKHLNQYCRNMLLIWRNKLISVCFAPESNLHLIHVCISLKIKYLKRHKNMLSSEGNKTLQSPITGAIGLAPKNESNNATNRLHGNGTTSRPTLTRLKVNVLNYSAISNATLFKTLHS
jgi:hypothetical protein